MIKQIWILWIIGAPVIFLVLLQIYLWIRKGHEGSIWFDTDSKLNPRNSAVITYLLSPFLLIFIGYIEIASLSIAIDNLKSKEFTSFSNFVPLFIAIVWFRFFISLYVDIFHRIKDTDGKRRKFESIAAGFYTFAVWIPLFVFFTNWVIKEIQL